MSFQNHTQAETFDLRFLIQKRSFSGPGFGPKKWNFSICVSIFNRKTLKIDTFFTPVFRSFKITPEPKPLAYQFLAQKGPILGPKSSRPYSPHVLFTLCCKTGQNWAPIRSYEKCHFGPFLADFWANFRRFLPNFL